MKNFLFTLIAFIGLLFLPVAASAASPEAVAAIAQAERSIVLESLWTQITANAAQVRPSDAEAAALVAKAREAQAAIVAEDYARADAALADLLELAVAASKPKVRA